MDINPDQLRSILQNARSALRRRDENEARRWAKQAARLAPELEDSWLLMAAVSSPRESLEYAQRAQAINPGSTRARKAVEWASHRAGGGAPSTSAAGQKSGMAAEQMPKRRSPLFPLLLVGLACAVITFAAWSVGKSSALASMVRNAEAPSPSATLESNYSIAEISKPTYTLEWTSTPTLTLTPTFTVTPSLTPTPEFTSTPLPSDTPTATDTPGVMEAAIIPDTPTPVRPTQAPAPTQQAYVQPGSSGGGGVHWIDINLSTQRLYAYEGDVVVNVFLVSTGVSATPTVTGTYSIYARYLYADMHGPDYFLPNVPYTMYFYKSYGIHGTYWHSNFGTPMSHGCVNLSIGDAAWLYSWSTFGTKVKIHY